VAGGGKSVGKLANVTEPSSSGYQGPPASLIMVEEQTEQTRKPKRGRDDSKHDAGETNQQKNGIRKEPESRDSFSPRTSIDD